jgi:hypothetical protein
LLPELGAGLATFSERTRLPICGVRQMPVQQGKIS